MAVKYGAQSTVMLYRRVGDAAFILQYYEQAHRAYRVSCFVAAWRLYTVHSFICHSRTCTIHAHAQACAKEVKKSQDEWLAGCLEMAVISGFLASTAPPKDFEAGAGTARALCVC